MRSDISENDSDALRLRCIRSITELDFETLQMVGSMLDRVAAPQPKMRKRGPRSERNRIASEKESTT